ncbi:hypothetical protein, partial [Faecalibaculum rodentium]|uniref:hypothetical protein n=1 Tax=Faecalibaculum rodentium TaxID=1702221 RepID=UPI00272F1107
MRLPSPCADTGCVCPVLHPAVHLPESLLLIQAVKTWKKGPGIIGCGSHYRCAAGLSVFFFRLQFSQDAEMI